MLGGRRIPTIPYWLALALAGMAEGWAKLTSRPPLYIRSEVRGASMQATYRAGEMSKAYRELRFLPRFSLDQGMQVVETWLRQAGHLP